DRDDRVPRLLRMSADLRALRAGERSSLNWVWTIVRLYLLALKMLRFDIRNVRCLLRGNERRQRARERKDAVDRKGIFRRVDLLGLSCLPRDPLQGSPCQTSIAYSPGGRPQP